MTFMFKWLPTYNCRTHAKTTKFETRPYMSYGLNAGDNCREGPLTISVSPVAHKEEPCCF